MSPAIEAPGALLTGEREYAVRSRRPADDEPDGAR